MATSASRKARSRETEKAVAAYLGAYVFPDAEAVASALPGKDIHNTPGVAVEVKARRALRLPEWLRQAEKNASSDELPVVISRPDGMGPQSVDNWPVTMRLYEFVRLLERAGYGQ